MHLCDNIKYSMTKLQNKETTKYTKARPINNLRGITV